MRSGVVLYGPPASGKDTVTAALAGLDPRFVPFERMKVGAGRRQGYRMAAAADVDQLRADGQVLYENEQYGALYVVDRPHLESVLADGAPVVHVGQPAAVDAIVGGVADVAWAVVELWCDRSVAELRLIARDPANVGARLAVWDRTPRLDVVALRLDTGVLSPADAARAIRDQLIGIW
jgi:guanylate kinase